MQKLAEAGRQKRQPNRHAENAGESPNLQVTSGALGHRTRPPAFSRQTLLIPGPVFKQAGKRWQIFPTKQRIGFDGIRCDLVPKSKEELKN